MAINEKSFLGDIKKGISKTGEFLRSANEKDNQYNQKVMASLASPKKVFDAYKGKIQAERRNKEMDKTSTKNMTKHIIEPVFGRKNQQAIHNEIKKLVKEGKYQEASDYTKSQMVKSGNALMKERVQRGDVRFRDKPTGL